MERRVGDLAARLGRCGAELANDAQRMGGTLGSRTGPARPRRPFTLRLVLTLALPVLTTVALLQLAPAARAAEAAPGCQPYTVRAGDTLGKLAAAYGTTVAAIASLNHIANPDLILIGQSLCIPGAAPVAAGSAPAQPGNPGRASGAGEFIGFALSYAQRAHRQTGWPLSLILAHWGVEQGWKAPGYTGYNFGNVAALPGEPTVHGVRAPGSPPAFAYANTPEDGLRYYVRVSQLAYYAGVAPAAKGGADAAARALGRSPWDAAHYTGRGDPGSTLIGAMQAHNLYQYDG